LRHIYVAEHAIFWCSNYTEPNHTLAGLGLNEMFFFPSDPYAPLWVDFHYQGITKTHSSCSGGQKHKEKEQKC
jgi:hypothetical protein